ncbi:MAG: hypothetical protein NC302_00730 [Bacteroidales bacterium]|nr:hypothetical protein [Bacteroidales bacterium]MCM1414421.1 hypothetical protein [bacterium]MCM1422300.1 hypothetical protein [bacterium]
MSVFGLLFVPVRYRIEAVRKEGEGEPPAAVRVKITWLLHFVNVLFRYAGEVQMRVRIAVITVFRYPKRERAAKRQKRRREKKERERTSEARAGSVEPQAGGTEMTAGGTAPEVGSTAIEKEDDTSSVKSAASHADGTEAVSAERQADRAETTAEPEDGEETASRGQSIWDKIRAFWEKILAFLRQVKDFFTNMQYTIRQFCDKIESVQSGIALRYEVLTSDQFREVWESCQKELGKVLRSLKPKKLEADIIVGMDDPAATGEILAVCGMLYPLFGGHVNVAGDFEQKRLEGRFFMKGKVSSFRLLWTGWKLYRNRKLRNIYRLLKEGGS